MKIPTHMIIIGFRLSLSSGGEPIRRTNYVDKMVSMPKYYKHNKYKTL